MKAPAPRKCSICKLPFEGHSPIRCDFCGRPLEHHQPGDVQAEEAGRRRMAAARQAAGSPLSELDRRVLRAVAA